MKTTRRETLTALGALGLAAGPAAAAAQEFDSFGARCRALTGFAILPRPLVEAARAEPGPDADDKTLLMALYTGSYEAGDGVVRIAYADALMFAATEEALNTPSFCGGLPQYWAQPPQNV
jgi:hypothetical protein